MAYHEALPKTSGISATIYHNLNGNFMKVEGVVVGRDDRFLYYYPKQGRTVRYINGFASKSIIVVLGYDQPDPESLVAPEDAGTSSSGLETGRSRYRSLDPRWLANMLNRLSTSKVIMTYIDGHWTNKTRLPDDLIVGEDYLD